MLISQHLKIVEALTGATPNPDSPYQEWQTHILSGNACFEQNDSATAIIYYQRAILIAEQLLQNDGEFFKSIASLIVSHHNLADAFLLQSDIDNAGHQLNAIHDQLLALQTQLTGDMAKQDALMWGLRRTYKALLLYSKQHSKARIIDVPKAKTLLPVTMQCGLMN